MVCNTYCSSTSNNGCTNAPECYVIRTLPVVFSFYLGLICVTDTFYLYSCLSPLARLLFLPTTPSLRCHRYNVTPSCSVLCWRPLNPEPLSPSLYQYHFQHARLLTAKSDVMPYWKDAAFLPYTEYNTLIYIIFDRRIAWRILIERLPRHS
jgi:hypothetical protein